MSILYESEEKRLYKVLKDMCGDGHSSEVLPFGEISNREEFILIRLSNKSMHIRLDKGYELSVKWYVSYYYWKLYVNGTKIDKKDEGPWWDIIRSDIIKFEQKVLNYRNELKKKREAKEMEISVRRERELQLAAEYLKKMEDDTNRKRANEFQRVENYKNGWRWWKFWWKLK